MSCDGDIGHPVPQYGTCVFECDPGYESLGSRFDLCLNGRWINGAPTCQRKWSMESFFGAGTSNSAFVLDLIMGTKVKRIRPYRWCCAGNMISLASVSSLFF